MPVRVVCPSCATQLNIKDEHAGRAVKCPKCNYVIPPAQASAPVVPPGAEMPATPAATAMPPSAGPPPLPKPENPAAPPLPVPSSSGGFPKPSRPLSLDDAPAPSRPTAKPAGAKPPRGRDDDDGDRPKKRSPRRRDDDDDDDRSRNRPAKKSSAPLILLIVGGIFLVCCGGAGAIGYYFYKKGKEVIETVGNINLRVNRGSYDRLTEGMTPSEVEGILGTGTIANPEQVFEAFPEINRARAGDWSDLAVGGRVVLWRNGDDYLLVAFYPTAANGRLQMKTFQPRGGFNSAEQKFATDAEAARPGWGIKKELLPAVEITAEELAKAYKANTTAADAKYKDKWVVVEGKINDINQEILGDVDVALDAIPAAPGKALGTLINCVFPPAAGKDAWKLSRGQKVKIRGKCMGYSDPYVTLRECKIENQEQDPSIQLRASQFFLEHSKNAQATDEKYAEKQVAVADAVVESKEGDVFLFLTSSAKKGPMLKIKATWPAGSRKQIESVKVGDRIKIKGEYSGSADGTIYINRCWLVP